MAFGGGGGGYRHEHNSWAIGVLREVPGRRCLELGMAWRLYPESQFLDLWTGVQLLLGGSCYFHVFIYVLQFFLETS